MITEWEMYWILKLDGLHMTFVLFALVSAITLGIAGIVWMSCDTEDNDSDRFFRVIKCSLISCIVCLIPAVFLPTTKEMAMIKVVPMITNSEIVREMPVDAKVLYRMGIEAIKEKLTEKKDAGK